MGVFCFTIVAKGRSLHAAAANPICSKYYKFQCRINEKR